MIKKSQRLIRAARATFILTTAALATSCFEANESTDHKPATVASADEEAQLCDSYPERPYPLLATAELDGDEWVVTLNNVRAVDADVTLDFYGQTAAGALPATQRVRAVPAEDTEEVRIGLDEARHRRRSG